MKYILGAVLGVLLYKGSITLVDYVTNKNYFECIRSEGNTYFSCRHLMDVHPAIGIIHYQPDMFRYFFDNGGKQ